MNFVPAIANHSCPNLTEKLSQPGNNFLAHPCTLNENNWQRKCDKRSGADVSADVIYDPPPFVLVIVPVVMVEVGVGVRRPLPGSLSRPENKSDPHSHSEEVVTQPMTETHVQSYPNLPKSHPRKSLSSASFCGFPRSPSGSSATLELSLSPSGLGVLTAISTPSSSGTTRLKGSLFFFSFLLGLAAFWGAIQ